MSEEHLEFRLLKYIVAVSPTQAASQPLPQDFMCRNRPSAPKLGSLKMSSKFCLF